VGIVLYYLLLPLPAPKTYNKIPNLQKLDNFLSPSPLFSSLRKQLKLFTKISYATKNGAQSFGRKTIGRQTFGRHAQCNTSLVDRQPHSGRRRLKFGRTNVCRADGFWPKDAAPNNLSSHSSKCSRKHWRQYFCSRNTCPNREMSMNNIWPGNTKGGSITVPLTSCLTGLESGCMTTDNFCFYLQNRLIQTSQTGGQR
jgi:hypothetical protein